MEEIREGSRVELLQPVYIESATKGFGATGKRKIKIDDGVNGVVERVKWKPNGHGRVRLFDVRFSGKLVEGLTADKVALVGQKDLSQ